MSSLVVRGGTLVTMDLRRRVVRGDLSIVGGRIAAIGAVQPEPGVPEIDATGRYVLPGFVQGHVHLGQALFRGLAEGRPLMDWLRERIWPLEAAHDHSSAYWSAMLGAADCLLGGTTTIQDIGLVHHMGAVYEAIARTGLRAIAGKCLMDRGEGVPERLVESTGAAFDEALALHERWHHAEDGRIRGALCPRFILSCSEQMWARCVALSHEHGLPIHTHLLEHPREEDEVRRVLGTSQLTYLDRLGVLDTDLRIAHAVQFTRAHVDELAGRPLRICHCPSANLKLGSGIADLGLLRSTPGVSVGIGCDGAPCNNDMDILEEIRLAALLQGIRQAPGRFGAEQALALATIDGARAIGMEQEVGSLEVGKFGDLVVLDLDKPATFGAPEVGVAERIVYGAARDAVCQVVVGGDVLVDGGTLPHLDPTALMRRPLEEVTRLLERAEFP